MASPYAYTKWLGEQHCQAYSQMYDLSTSIARFFLVYGPRQISVGEYATVVGIFEEQNKSNLPLTVTGTGEQRRDFIHVADVVEALIQMSAGDWRGQIFNLGTGIANSINEIASMFGGERKYIPRPHGEVDLPHANMVDTYKMLPNWKAKIRIEDYIARTKNSSHC